MIVARDLEEYLLAKRDEGMSTKKIKSVLFNYTNLMKGDVKTVDVYTVIEFLKFCGESDEDIKEFLDRQDLKVLVYFRKL